MRLDGSTHVWGAGGRLDLVVKCGPSGPPTSVALLSGA
jgi:hypothetical protein